MSTPAILHLDLDSFFVSVERLHNPALMGLPVIVGGSTSRGVVAAASYEARQFGVYSAMPIHQARRLCPHAIYLKGDMHNYGAHSAHVTQIIADRAPLFEKSSIDEFYLDLTGMDRFFGIEKWAWELRETIMRETRLPISAGLSINKTVAKMATNAAKPNGRLHVPEQEVLAFLAPQPVERMNMIGEAATRTLNQMGIATLGQLAATPRQTLITALGKHGDMLWRRANVQDRPPIVPYREAKSISNEHTFSEDIADLKLLHASLLGMVEKVGYKLRLKKRMASILTVKIRYADFHTVTRQLHFPFTAREDVLYPIAIDLFTKLHTRPMRIRLVGVRFSGLVHANPQMQLFDEGQKQDNLLLALDHIRGRFGLGAVGRAGGLFATQKPPAEVLLATRSDEQE